MRPFGFHAAAFFVQYLNAFNKQKGELIMFIEKKKWAAGLLLALAVMITAFCLAVAGIMVLFAVLSPDAVMSIEMPLLYIMPGLLYSGLSWPDFYMSDVAAAIAQIFPMRHAADSVRDILLAGYAPALVSQSLQLLLMGAGAFALGTTIFALRRRYGMKTFLEITAGAIARKRKGVRS